MKNNAIEMAQKVRTGYFIKEAIKKAESLLREEKEATADFVKETFIHTSDFKMEEEA